MNSVIEPGLKNSEVSFEDHAVDNLKVIADIHPSAIGAWFAFVAIVQHPLVRSKLVKFQLHATLQFRQQLVVYFYVAVWSPPDQDLSSAVNHLVEMKLKDLAVVYSAKDLESESVVGPFLAYALWK